MDTKIVLACVSYICLLNVCIGLYLGLFGVQGFARPRPAALLIMLLGMGAPLLFTYAQNKHGFKAQPTHIVISLAFLAVAFVCGRIWRRPSR